MEQIRVLGVLILRIDNHQLNFTDDFLVHKRNDQIVSTLPQSIIHLDQPAVFRLTKLHYLIVDL